MQLHAFAHMYVHAYIHTYIYAICLETQASYFEKNIGLFAQ